MSILWGEKDPWEKLEWGRGFQKHQVVEEFVVIPGAGTLGGNLGEGTMHEMGLGLNAVEAPGGQQSLLSSQVATVHCAVCLLICCVPLWSKSAGCAVQGMLPVASGALHCTAATP